MKCVAILFLVTLTSLSRAADSDETDIQLESLVEALQSPDKRAFDFKQFIKELNGKFMAKFKGSNRLTATKEKPGTCPAMGPANDACVSDQKACVSDSDCGNDDSKCCKNSYCGYNECLSVRQNLACPTPKTMMPTERSEKRCLRDTQCGLDEKCCDWFGDKHCLKGISTAVKPGLCPAPDLKSECKQDFPSCFHDAECSGKMEKCCYNPKCSYHECRDMNADFACPTVQLDKITTQSKSCSSHDDCNEFSVLCCNIKGKKVCTNGIHTVENDGVCPKSDTLGGVCSPLKASECEYDSECVGQSKCCDNKCGKKECVALDGVDKRDMLETLLAALKTDKK